jgi:hypothetical protein
VLPEFRGLADRLLDPMNFAIFYDNRAQTDCNVNAALGNQHTGTMYGGYYVDRGPAPYHLDTLYSDPRIAIYIGMGMHQMPGDVWWRTWRTLPPKQCPTDPDYSSQGQWPVAGVLADLHRPAVRQKVQRLGGPSPRSGTSPATRVLRGRKGVPGGPSEASPGGPGGSGVGLCLPGREDDPLVPISEAGPGVRGSAPAIGQRLPSPAERSRACS